MSAEMESASVQVVVRMRPLNEREQKGNTLPVVTASTEKKEVVVIKGAGNRQQRTTYNFDNVLGSLSSQEEVFQQTIQPVIPDVLGGFECTMFAYGQTGTGKTHTMEGDLSSEERQGVIPRAAQAIFDHLADPKYRDAEVTASYLEIYNEELSDLLIEDTKHEVKLQICEDNKPRGKGLFVHNLSEVRRAVFPPPCSPPPAAGTRAPRHALLAARTVDESCGSPRAGSREDASGRVEPHAARTAAAAGRRDQNEQAVFALPLLVHPQGALEKDCFGRRLRHGVHWQAAPRRFGGQRVRQDGRHRQGGPGQGARAQEHQPVSPHPWPRDQVRCTAASNAKARMSPHRNFAA
jgi:hypothetical protein